MKCVLVIIALVTALVLGTGVPAEAKVHRHDAKTQLQTWRSHTAIAFARKQLGRPYRWGAAGPRAFDCSGLIQRAYKRAGRRLPRVTHAQYRAVRRKIPRRHLRPGDLVFFNGRRHVGIFVGRHRFIHSPRTGLTVRTQRLKGYYWRSFAGAVRP